LKTELQWEPVTEWPEDPVEFLGIDEDSLEVVKARYDAGFVLERFPPIKANAYARCRIPCRYGSIWPYFDGFWCWVDDGKSQIADRIIEELGEHASSPTAGVLDLESLGRTVIIRFPDDGFSIVEGIVVPYRRSSEH